MIARASDALETLLETMENQLNTGQSNEVVGVLHYRPMKALFDPTYGFARDPDIDGPPIPPHVKVSEWPRITRATKHNGSFILHAQSGRNIISLKFNPDAENSGNYQIKPMGRGQRDEGRTDQVIVVEGDLLRRPLYRLLEPFTHRFAVATFALPSGADRKGWLIGFNRFEEATDAE
jgi:hypothetical protein